MKENTCVSLKKKKLKFLDEKKVNFLVLGGEKNTKASEFVRENLQDSWHSNHFYKAILGWVKCNWIRNIWIKFSCKYTGINMKGRELARWVTKTKHFKITPRSSTDPKHSCVLLCLKKCIFPWMSWYVNLIFVECLQHRYLESSPRLQEGLPIWKPGLFMKLSVYFSSCFSTSILNNCLSVQ